MREKTDNFAIWACIKCPSNFVFKAENLQNFPVVNFDEQEQSKNILAESRAFPSKLSSDANASVEGASRNSGVPHRLDRCYAPMTIYMNLR